MVKGHHLQLWKWPLLFHDFKQFSIKAAKVQCSVIQEAVQELLAKGDIEPSSGGTGFYSYVVYSLYSVLSDLITICIYLLLRCLLFDRYSNLSNRVVMLSPLVFMILTYTLLLFNIIIACCILFDEINLISGRVCHLGLLQPLGFQLLLNPYCFFASARVLILLFIWMMSFSWFALGM